ncbi:murein transglycosylase A [Desulfomicrobium escambiense]|uniref:murein transglycosylase A n=1 Tax=Desulfomicrobium escambiense TaxID=29503 RepID=UPI0004238AC2|nr:murein transglycosylase A [Desulfomicrobium escambiense]
MRLLAAAVALTLLCACAAPGKAPSLVEARPGSGLAARVANAAAADPVPMAQALLRSLDYVRTKPLGAQAFGPGGPECTWAELAASLEHMLEVLPRLGGDPGLLEREFIWREVRPEPLMTGYYEPEFEGSLVPDPRFPVPIYGLPADLQTVDLGAFHPRWKGQTLTCRVEGGKVLPPFTREEIDSRGALAGAQPPVAWTRDIVDVYFLQVQGSGRLRLPDGSVRHVLYAGKNGHEYVSLGKVMIDRGLVPKEEMSMQRIRQYLREHPADVTDLLNTNPSYVFFRIADDGPLGAMGRALTPMVSVATDSAFLPLGSILAVEAGLPQPGGSAESAAFLGLAQDRGGAIKGSRLDLFCGAGERAEFLAGHLQAPSRVFLLLKKQDAP